MLSNMCSLDNIFYVLCEDVSGFVILAGFGCMSKV